MTDLHATISQAARVLLALRGWQQKDLAQRMAMSPTELSRKVRGDRKWHVDDMELLARVFSVAPAALLGSTDELVRVAQATGTGTESPKSVVAIGVANHRMRRHMRRHDGRVFRTAEVASFKAIAQRNSYDLVNCESAS